MLNYRSEIQNFFNKEWLVLLVLSFLLMNFFGLNTYWKAVIVFVVVLRVLPKLPKLIDFNFFLLTLYLVLYIFFLNYHNFQDVNDILTQLSLLLLPLSLYVLGKYFATNYPFKVIFKFIVLFIIIFMSLIPFLSNVLDIFQNGFMNNRDIWVIWSNTDLGLKNATNVAASFSLNMTLFGMLFVFAKDKFELSIRRNFLILFIIGLVSIMNMSTRTGILLAVISSVVILLNKNKSKVFYKIAFVILVLLFIAYITGFFDWFVGSFLYQRFYDVFSQTDYSDSRNLPRVFRWGAVIEGFLYYPLGGQKTNIILNTYAHNLWLDVGWKVGIIPLIPLLIITFNFFKSVLRTIRNNYYSIFFRAIVLSISIGFMLQFMVEPIMEGYFINFCIWCLFIGYFQIIAKKNYNMMG